MARSIKPFRNQMYGTPSPLSDVFPSPIVAKRDPTDFDIGFELGQIWVNSVTGASFILSQIMNGEANWLGISNASEIYRFLVGGPESGAPYFSIQEAINAAKLESIASGIPIIVWVLAGDYTESFSMETDVIVSGFLQQNGIILPTKVFGTVTFNNASSQLFNISIIGQSNHAMICTGSNVAALLQNVQLRAASGFSNIQVETSVGFNFLFDRVISFIVDASVKAINQISGDVLGTALNSLDFRGIINIINNSQLRFDNNFLNGCTMNVSGSSSIVFDNNLMSNLGASNLFNLSGSSSLSCTNCQMTATTGIIINLTGTSTAELSGCNLQSVGLTYSIPVGCTVYSTQNFINCTAPVNFATGAGSLGTARNAYLNSFANTVTTSINLNPD